MYFLYSKVNEPDKFIVSYKKKKRKYSGRYAFRDYIVIHDSISSNRIVVSTNFFQLHQLDGKSSIVTLSSSDPIGLSVYDDLKLQLSFTRFSELYEWACQNYPEQMI